MPACVPRQRQFRLFGVRNCPCRSRQGIFKRRFRGDYVRRLHCSAVLLFWWDLIRKLRQHGSISDVAAGDLDSPYFQCSLVDPKVHLAPNTAFGTTMLAGIPFTFALGFDAGAIDQEVQRTVGTTILEVHVQRLLTMAQRAEVRNRSNPTRSDAIGSRRSRSFASAVTQTAPS